MERNEILAIANEPPIKKRKLCKTKVITGNNKDNDNNNDIMNELKDIVFRYENGLRKIKPYHYNYKTFAKGRWLGRSILDIFITEFRDRSKEYYTFAIEKGLITINEKIVKTETKVKNQDIIEHKIHRHEPPITSTPINILYKEKDLIVINKPASIPVHPSGRYRHNTVLHILKKEHGFSNDLYTINRLDRLTSGIMLLALSKEKAQELEQQMRQRKIKKEYICRVFGKFPDGEIICEQPIKCVSHKLGLNIVDKNGKPSTTIFEKISCNKNTSVVRCKPLTGRTHQIRVHLQYLGYPIANDPLYCNKKVWGSDLGKGRINEETGGGCDEDDNDQPSIKKIIEKLSNEGEDDNEIYLNLKKTDNEQSKEKIELIIGDKNEEFNGEFGINYCKECNKSEFSDPKPNQLLIWLHALKYEGEGWEFKTDLPDWAKDNYIIIDEN